jgi:hypothetical protein
MDNEFSQIRLSDADLFELFRNTNGPMTIRNDYKNAAYELE